MTLSRWLNLAGSIVLLVGVCIWAYTVLWDWAYFLFLESTLLLSMGLWFQVKERKVEARPYVGS
jgi:hypothetical protein